MAYEMQFHAGVGYPLPVTTFCESDLLKAQQQTTAAMLNKYNMNRHFPRSIAFGPISMAGLQMTNLYTEQGMHQIMMCINSMFKNNQVGKTIQISLSISQLESGKSYHLLEQPNIAILYLTSTWVTSLRQFLGDNAMHIQQSNNSISHTCGSNDMFLMDIISTSGLTITEQTQINTCRMFLGATTLSDIATADGKMISNEAMLAQKMTDRISPLTWPSQPYLTKQQINSWTKFLYSQFVSTTRYLKSL
jgi:hypothetical protein